MCENIYVYANGWTDRSGYKTASSEVQANMRKVSHSILQTASCAVRAVPVCMWSRLPPVSFYRYRLQFLFIPARIIPVLNPSICSVVDAVNRPRNVPTSW